MARIIDPLVFNGTHAIRSALSDVKQLGQRNIAYLYWTQFQVIKSLISYKHCICYLSLALYHNNDKDDLSDIRSNEKKSRDIPRLVIANRHRINQWCAQMVLCLYLLKFSWSLEARRFGVIDDHITLKYDRHNGSAAVEGPIKGLSGRFK